jgi:hypothetical protein
MASLGIFAVDRYWYRSSHTVCCCQVGHTHNCWVQKVHDSPTLSQRHIHDTDNRYTDTHKHANNSVFKALFNHNAYTHTHTHTHWHVFNTYKQDHHNHHKPAWQPSPQSIHSSILHASPAAAAAVLMQCTHAHYETTHDTDTHSCWARPSSSDHKSHENSLLTDQNCCTRRHSTAEFHDMNQHPPKAAQQANMQRHIKPDQRTAASKHTNCDG